ncbi:hypothetical protein BBJ28_00016121 [Nothophytophthora sp. Chile5]|nr:hypothetical protein BBJ28_00016121 [Nothophytophthora sp. Chile5]
MARFAQATDLASLVDIRPYQVTDHDAVVRMYVDGMRSYSFHDEDEASKAQWEQVRKASVESDLADIDGWYMAQGGNFWVATVSTDNRQEELIGMVGLEPPCGGVGVLRRMSVKEDYRRFGVGRKLTTNLELWAVDHGFRRVELTTGMSMTRAVEFYLRADGSSPAIAIRQFRTADLPQIAELFIEGMRHYPEYKDDAGLPAHIQECLNTDLGDIEGTYIAPGGNFWVATLQSDPSLVVGMVGLEAKADGEGEVRRLFVKDTHKRLGIGRLLVVTLEKWAQMQGYRKARLMTGAMMFKARALYASAGYTQTEIYVIQEDPYFEGVRYEKLVGKD